MSYVHTDDQPDRPEKARPKGFTCIKCCGSIPPGQEHYRRAGDPRHKECLR